MKPAHASRLPNRRLTWLAMAGLIVAGLLVYSNSLRGPLVFDDVEAIAENPTIRALFSWKVLSPPSETGTTVAGRPVLNLTFAANYAFGRDSVTGYHVFNGLLHVASGLLLFGIIRRTLRKVSSQPFEDRREVGRAFFAALLWLVHPLQTQSITYIVQRAEALVGFFFLLTLYGFIRSTHADRSSAASGWRWLSWFACLLGMASKEVMVGAPIIVLLYDRTFIAESFTKAWHARQRYYLGLAVTWLILAWVVIKTGGRGGTAGFGTEIASWNYLLTQCRAVIHYLGLTIWPAPLVFDYGTTVVRSVGEVWWQAVLLAGLLTATIVALRKWPVWGFLGAVFFTILAPSSSVVPIASQTVAEHRMYLPLAVVMLVLVLGLFRWLGPRVWLVCAVFAMTCGGLTLARNRDYRSELQLWSDTVAKCPDNSRAHNNLGKAVLATGDANAAIGHYERAIQLEPKAPEPYLNLGLALARLNRIPEAIARYEEALRLQPAYADARDSLGTALLAQGRISEAILSYQQAMELKPTAAAVRSNLANALLEAGRTDEALSQASEAVRLDPKHAEAQYNLGTALAQSRQISAALPHFEAAVQLRPTYVSAHNNLANVLVELNRLPEAIPHYEAALKLNPNLMEARRNLGLVLANSGQLREAIVHFEILVRAHPGDAEAREVLQQLRAAVQP